jgi:diadenosine tetraphosphate (Ap4A) HIT family hydrolase
MEESVSALPAMDSPRVADCPLCGLETASEEPPGGWVYRDEHWSLGALPGLEVPGWLILQSRRHVETLWDVAKEGANTLGSLLARTSHEIHRALEPEHVYLLAVGETMAHWHMLIAATPEGLAPELRGAHLLANAKNFLDADTAVRVAGGVRDGLANGRV